jgi:hypothetical protein
VIVHTRLDSAHLAGNLLGNTSERDLFVYLPPGYDESDQRYPTAYLLHPAIYVPMQGPSELGAGGKLLTWDRTADLPTSRSRRS